MGASKQFLTETVYYGDKGLTKTYQSEFPKLTKCLKCGSEARHAFTVMEDSAPYTCDIQKNDPKGEGYWPHDAVAVAIYFCKECMNPTAEYNQG